MFVKPNVLIIADDIVLDSVHSLELRFHPENQATRDRDGAFVATGKTTTLRIEPLTTTGVEVATGVDAMTGERGKSEPGTFSIRLRANKAAWRNAVALSWAGVQTRPARIHLEQRGDRWSFDCAGHDVTLDWGAGTARFTLDRHEDDHFVRTWRDACIGQDAAFIVK